MEAFKGRLAPDGNRSGRVKAQAGFTARGISRAVGKPELSEPTMVSRTVEDHQIKVTPGIGSVIRAVVQPIRKDRNVRLITVKLELVFSKLFEF